MRLLAALLVLALPFAAARAADGDAQTLVDFLTLAIAPEGEGGQTLVEVGEAEAEQARLDAVIRKLPRGFLGLDLLNAKRTLDGAAALALCREACRANEICRDITYTAPTDDRAVGLCTLKRARVAENFGRMSPVVDAELATSPPAEAELAPATPEEQRAEEDIPPPELPAITPARLRLPPPRNRALAEDVPPPPALPPIEVVDIGLPPRAVPTAPPRDITKPPPAMIAEPATTPVDVVETEPPARKRGLPLWLALGAIAVMIGGAAVYRRNYNLRQRARLTTRLVSNGLDRQTVTIEGGEPAFSLKVVRVAANANARIELIPKGTPA
jgi:hypothetical protein